MVYECKQTELKAVKRAGVHEREASGLISAHTAMKTCFPFLSTKIVI